MIIKLSVFTFLLVLCFFSSFGYDIINEQPVEVCPENLNQKKLCNYRGTQNIKRMYWNYMSGWYCYSYTSPERFKIKYDKYIVISTTCSITQTSASLPAIPISGNKYAFLDYDNKTYMDMMKTQFKTDVFFEIFKDCLKQAKKCCDEEMNDEDIIPSENYCSVVWDGWDCFPQTKVNNVARKVCSQQAYSSFSQRCKLESEKECFFNKTTNLAQWVEQTSYENCPIAPVYKKRHRYNVITLGIAVAVAFPAIVILLSYRKLRASIRMCLHRNLLIVIVIRNILTMITKEEIIIDQLNSKSNDVMLHNGVPCRILAFTENVFKNGIYACMLIDGFYLHKQIVRNFAKEPNTYVLYIASAAISLIPSIIWATVKAVNNVQYCWQVDSNNEQWIVDGVRIVVLIINVLLLLDIIRTIFTRMKQGGTSRQTKAAFRSTLLLIPLFGLHFIVTADKSMVYDDSCLAEDIYYYARYSMEALQGIMVAILFCYLNEEVRTVLKNSFRRFNIFVEQKFGWKLCKPKPDDRRATTATFVGDPSNLSRY